MRKITFFTLIMMVMLSVSACGFSEKTPGEQTGTHGANLEWHYQNGILTVRGSGDMIFGRIVDDELAASVEHVILSDGITSIGGGAFYGCSAISDISIPDSVVSIGDYAFSGCSALTGLSIPESVTSIGDHAFSGCSSLTELVLPDKITSISAASFKSCTGLARLTVPDGITRLDHYAFYECPSLKDISWQGKTFVTVSDFLDAYENGN